MPISFFIFFFKFIINSFKEFDDEYKIEQRVQLF